MEYMTDYKALNEEVEAYFKEKTRRIGVRPIKSSLDPNMKELHKSNMEVTKGWVKIGKSLLLDQILNLQTAEALFFYGETDLAQRHFGCAKTYHSVVGEIPTVEDAIKKIEDKYCPKPEQLDNPPESGLEKAVV